MTLEPGGELAFRLAGEEVRLKKPRLYQERGDAREEVDGGYRIVDAKSREVAFQIGADDRTRALIIDPTIVFATYRGGADTESPKRSKPTPLAKSTCSPIHGIRRRCRSATSTRRFRSRLRNPVSASAS